MVRNLIGARFRHGEHSVPGIGRDTGGQNLLVGQRDGGAARCHRDGTALGADSKGGGKAGTGGAGGSGGTGKNGGLHGRAQLGGQQRLLLHHIGQGILYAPIDVHDLVEVGDPLQSWQDAQNILQFLAFRIENVAQASSSMAMEERIWLTASSRWMGGSMLGKLGIDIEMCLLSSLGRRP